MMRITFPTLILFVTIVCGSPATRPCCGDEPGTSSAASAPSAADDVSLTGPALSGPVQTPKSETPKTETKTESTTETKTESAPTPASPRIAVLPKAPVRTEVPAEETTLLGGENEKTPDVTGSGAKTADAKLQTDSTEPSTTLSDPETTETEGTDTLVQDVKGTEVKGTEAKGTEAKSGESKATVEKRPPAPAPLTPELLELRERIRDCLGYYYNDYENVVDHSPWGIMHVLIAYGVDTQVYANGSKTNAIGYLCWNGSCRGQQLFYVNRNRLEARIGPGVQGHDGQFLAMMAQSKVSMDYPMYVQGQDFTLKDLIEYEKRTCEAGTELTFKLIGLAHYLDTETTWKNDRGEKWDIARLVKEELAQPIIGAACGGTHRLMGFNYAVRKRQKEGKPMTGQYLRARKFLDDYFEYTFYLQNSDGSFSTDFFRGRNSYGDINQRLETSGHILEWFVASLSNEQLRDPRVIKGINYLTNLMLRNRSHEWEIGPKGHALHALATYDERVFGDLPGSRHDVLSRSKKKHLDDLPRR